MRRPASCSNLSVKRKMYVFELCKRFWIFLVGQNQLPPNSNWNEFNKKKFHSIHRILSDDELHLLEIPEPPTIVSKIDNRSSIGSGSAITTELKATKSATNKSQHQYQQSQSSIIYENENVHEHIETASTDVKSAINNLKNIIQKLQSVN